MTSEQFAATLLKLQQERHLLYFSRNTDDIRFSDPLMGPFLRAMIFPSPKQASRDQQTLFDEIENP